MGKGIKKAEKERERRRKNELIEVKSIRRSLSEGEEIRYDDSEFPVVLEVMRSGWNENRWDFSKETFAEHVQSLRRKPILVALIGGKVNDKLSSHNGEKEGDWTRPESERIFGFLEDEPIKVEERDGELYAIAKGFICMPYGKEVVQYIVNNEQMPVSAEVATDPEHEIDHGNGYLEFMVWKGYGVTGLGVGVKPAIPGAHMRAASKITESDILTVQNEYDLLVASKKDNEETEDKRCKFDSEKECRDKCEQELCNNGDKNKVNVENVANNNQIVHNANNIKQKERRPDGMSQQVNRILQEQLQEFFKDYKLIGFSKDGNIARLMDKKDYKFYVYVKNDQDDGAFNVKRLYECKADVVTYFRPEGAEKDIMLTAAYEDVTANYADVIGQLTEQVKTLTAEVETHKTAANEAREEVGALKLAEQTRSRESMKKALLSHRAEVENLGMPEKEKVDSEKVDKLLAAIAEGKYDNSVDENGVFNGDAVVIEKFGAMAHEQRMLAMKEQQKRNPAGNPVRLLQGKVVAGPATNAERIRRSAMGATE